VILFPPAGFGNGSAIIKGAPTDWGNPLPWKKTAETPNLGNNDSTDDIRPGLGWDGLEHLQAFVNKGGVLVAVDDTASFAANFGFLDGVSVSSPQRMRIVGTVVKTRVVDGASPIAYGYEDKDSLSAYCNDGPIFGVSNVVGRRGGGRRLGAEMSARPTGRGQQSDLDFTPGRELAAPEPQPEFQPWEAAPVTEEQRRNNIGLIPPALRPRVIFRYSEARDLLVSGLVENGGEIAEHPSIVDSPKGKGHVVLFSTNPIYRGETEGTYSLVLNAIMNFDNLNAGRKLADK
jgi:hypothetical protein